MSDYPPSGALFNNSRKKSDKAPDFTGTVEFDRALLNAIAKQLDSGERLAKMQIAGWRRTARGRDFISLRVNPPYEPEGERQSYQQGAQQNSQRSSQIDDEIPF